MRTADRFGLRASVPDNWALAITRHAEPAVLPSAVGDSAPAPNEDRAHPIVHASTRPLPAGMADFGAGLLETFGPDDILVTLVEYGDGVADVGLFARQGVPRLAPAQFSPARLQRYLPGLSASQHFFSVGGRAFCLYTVIGSHARRMATVPRADAVARTVRVADATTMRAQGGMP